VLCAVTYFVSVVSPYVIMSGAKKKIGYSVILQVVTFWHWLCLWLTEVHYCKVVGLALVTGLS
jgi:hypothetical protein